MSCNSPFFNQRANSLCPCGYCAGCKADKLTMWTDRLKFELMSGRRVGTFFTLTYSDDYVPADGVSKAHAHKFLKDFRYLYDKKYGRELTWNRNGDWHHQSKYKYVLVSEYGDKDYRPHYHGIVTNCDCWSDSTLFDCWEYGFKDLKPANPSTIRYVFKYIAEEDNRIIIRNGDGMVLPKPFHQFSKGIGKDYIFAHANDIRKDRGVRIGAKVRPVSNYYKQLLGIGRADAFIQDDDKRTELQWYVEHNDIDLTPKNFNAVFAECKRFFGRPKELSAQVKADNDIKHLRGLKEL